MCNYLALVSYQGGYEGKGFWHFQVNYHLARQLDFQDNFSNEANVLACSNKLVEVSQLVMLLLQYLSQRCC